MSVADSEKERDGLRNVQRSHTLDPLATVRRHPEWYFRSGTFDENEATGLLVAEALRCRSIRVSVQREGDWVTVHGDVDWLGGDLAAFVSPQAYVEGGRNSSRIEVALVAFCRAVVTSTPDSQVTFWSNDDEEVLGELRAEPITSGRLVAFLPPEGPDATTGAPQQTGELRPKLRLVPNEGQRVIMSAVESFVRKQESDT